MWIIAAIVVGVIAVVVGSQLLSAKSAPAVGSPAPEFTLSSQEEKSVSLKDYRGKWVVLYFYPKDFTSGCTVEAHNFQHDLAEYQKRNAVILGVSVQDEKSHKQFCAKEGLNFKLLADTQKKVSKSYDSVLNLGIAKLSSRHTFLIDPQGVIRKIWLDVDVAKHSTNVLATLDGLEKK